MAEFIGSRSCIQCRTHHQKYEQKFGSTKKIVQIYKDEVGYTNYKRLAKDLSNKGFIELPNVIDRASEQYSISHQAKEETHHN